MPALTSYLFGFERGELEALPYLLRRWLRSAAARGALASLGLLACVWIVVEWLSLEQISQHARAAAETVKQIGIEHSQVELRLGRVEGLEQISIAEVEQGLRLPRQGSVFELSTSEIRNTVEELSWIARAEVRIGLSGLIHLRVVEETPVALWWTGPRWWFVNRSGKGFAWAEQGAPSQGLPRVVGPGAGHAVAEVRAMLAGHAGLFDGSSIFERIGGRRWNVRLPSGILLMLPEEAPLRALAWLRGSGLLHRFSGHEVEAIDLRNRSRIPIRLRLSEEERRALTQAETNVSL